MANPVERPPTGAASTEASVTLLPDDYLVLFSDGISEAMNDAAEEFGTTGSSARRHTLAYREEWCHNTR